MKIKPSLAEDATPEAYAEAMVLCQGWAPACSDANQCMYDGDCFSGSGKGYSSAKKQLEDLIDAQSDIHARVWLKLALNSLEHHRFIGMRTLDAKKLIAINERVRAEYKADS